MTSQRSEGAAEAVEDHLRTDADEQRDRVRAAGGRVLVARRAALARGAGAALHLARLRARPRGARAGAAGARRALRRRARRPLPPPAARQVPYHIYRILAAYLLLEYLNILFPYDVRVVLKALCNKTFPKVTEDLCRRVGGLNVPNTTPFMS